MARLTKEQRRTRKAAATGRKIVSPSLRRLSRRFKGDAEKILALRAESKKGELPKYAWPGGYPIYYLAAERGKDELIVACASCASGHKHFGSGDHVVEDEVNWEDPDLYCEFCNKRIESAYAEKD